MEDFNKEVSKETAALAKELYLDAIKPSVVQMGMALGAITEFVLQWSYPLRMSNAKRQYEYDRNINLLKDKFSKIPEANIIEVPPEISIPLLKRLSYTSNEKIAELYANILSRAANVATAGNTHPAFTQMLERISVDEALIMQELKGKTKLLYCHIRVKKNNSLGGYVDIFRQLTILRKLTLDFEDNIESYLSNFIGMGLLIDHFPSRTSNISSYEEIKELYKQEFDDHVKFYKKEYPTYEVTWEPSFFTITPFGQLFINACTNYTKLKVIAMIDDKPAREIKDIG